MTLFSRTMSLPPTGLLNAGLFQMAWLGFVAGAGAGQAWWGLPALVGLMALSVYQQRWRADFSWVLVALVYGAWLEWIWIHWQVLDYGSNSAPWWILALWMSLALTLNHSLHWLRRQPWLAAALGALTAPLSYGAGEAFGAVTIGDGMIWISLAWGLTFLLIFSLQRSSRFKLQEVRL